MWIFLNPAATMLSLQFNSVLTITFLAILLIFELDRYLKKNTIFVWGLFFLLVGATTSYIDLLTFPLLTLGIPLIVWIVLNYSETLRVNIKNILTISSFWTIGYGGLWASKWVLGSLITKTNIISNAMDTVQFRTSSNLGGNSFTYFELLKKEINNSFTLDLGLIGIAMLAFFIIKVIHVKRIDVNSILTYLIIAIFPFAWYFVLKGHSYVHYWFTYRVLAITIYALMTLILLYPKHKIEK